MTLSGLLSMYCKSVSLHSSWLLIASFSSVTNCDKSEDVPGKNKLFFHYFSLHVQIYELLKSSYNFVPKECCSFPTANDLTVLF